MDISDGSNTTELERKAAEDKSDRTLKDPIWLQLDVPRIIQVVPLTQLMEEVPLVPSQRQADKVKDSIWLSCDTSLLISVFKSPSEYEITR